MSKEVAAAEHPVPDTSEKVQRALMLLLKRNRAYYVRVCVNCGVLECDVDEVLQEAGVSIFTHPHNLEGVEGTEDILSRWINSAVRQSASEFRRRQYKPLYRQRQERGPRVHDSHNQQNLSELWTFDGTATDEDASERRAILEEIKLMIEDFIPTLPSSQRAVATLSWMEGKTIQEIADALGKAYANVKSTLGVARNALREHLRTSGFDIHSHRLTRMLSGEEEALVDTNEDVKKSAA